MVFHQHNLQNKSFFWRYYRWVHEVSPYRQLANQYRDEIGLPCYWMDYHSVVGRLLGMLGFRHFALRGLPLPAAAGLLKWAKAIAPR
jgi:hypothetical protein